MASRLIAVALCLAPLVACHEPAQNPPPPAEGAAGASVVARFGELEISATDVDARILALPPAERPKPGENLDAWYEEQIRELVVEDRLRAEAAENRLAESEDFLHARAEIEKQLAVQLCLAELRPDLEAVTDEAVRAAYDEHADRYSAPERRAVYHLYLRLTPERPLAAARQEITALRDRVLAGESFQRLAAEYSDSESRHQEGSLGWVTPGQLPAGFGDVIFALEEGVPSEPVATRDGLHLFYVDQILAPRQTSFEEVRQVLREQLVAERRQAALNGLEEQVERPPGSLVLDRAGFVAVVQSEDPEAVVLRLGDTEITLAELRQRVHQQLNRQEAQPGAAEGRSGAGARAGGELGWQILEQLRHRELTYQYCRSAGKIPETQLASRMETWQRLAILTIQRQRRLLELAGRDEPRLRAFYDSNIGLFSKPPRWTLRRLRIPLGEDAKRVMARLEAAAARPRSTLEALRAELGGEIDDLGSKTLAELGVDAPKLAALVAPLAAGRLSAPYRTARSLEIVEAVDRQDSEPLAFDEARERVAAAYLEQYTPDLYRELRDEILGTASLEILPEGLIALRETGLPWQPGLEPPPAEVSVEELESLLDEL